MELENGYVENLDRSKISNPLIDDTLLAKARIQFIRKVFIILSIQILITVIMTLGSMFATEYFLYQLDNMWLLYSFIGLLTITQITVLFFPAGRKYPLNMVLLLFFTIGEGYFVSFICSIAGKASGNDVVFMAAIMSLSVVIAATVYAFHTKDDFIIKWGILIVIICSLLMMTIFLATGYSEAAYTIYCTLAAIIFGIYIIIDIKSICGSRRYGMSLDDYVAGAIILYIDIIQLFLYIIRILSKKK